MNAGIVLLGSPLPGLVFSSRKNPNEKKTNPTSSAKVPKLEAWTATPGMEPEKCTVPFPKEMGQ